MNQESSDHSDVDVDRKIQSAYEKVQVPEHLWLRIGTTVKMHKRKSAASHGDRFRAWLLPICAAALFLSVAGVFWPPLSSDQSAKVSEETLPEALISEFATFVSSGRDFDIKSSDARTLSTWFKSRLQEPLPPDPPIGAELRLAGGRLCNIQRNRVAAYMYKVGHTSVSLYITRSNGEHKAMGSNTERLRLTVSNKNEFAYVTWQYAGWQYSLVAELPEEEISRIATMMSTQLIKQGT